MDIGALPRRCRHFSLTERPVCYIFEAPLLGKCRTGHDFFIWQRPVCFILEAPFLGKCRAGYDLFIWQRRNGSFLLVKNGREIDWLPVNDARRGWLFFRTGHDLFICQWRNGSFLLVKNGREHDWLPVNDARRAWLFLRGYEFITCR